MGDLPRLGGRSRPNRRPARRGAPVAAAALAVVLYASACGVATPAHPERAATLAAQLSSLGLAPSGDALTTTPCAGAAAATVASAAGQVAVRIYQQELSSTAVRADQRQVEGYAPLLGALAAENAAAARAAVTALVFSHTHIVRLRVISRRGLLVDVGGPDIIAPVGGRLRSHGAAVGRYLLSVQDDLGYVKLATRFIGAPLTLTAAGRRLAIEGTVAFNATGLPQIASVSYRGAQFESFAFDARAFPDTTLRVTLLVSTARLRASDPCAAIRATELGNVGRRIWTRYARASAPPSAYVRAIANLTGGLSFIRAGARLLAGTTRSAPRALPPSGTLSYRGRVYYVSSFAARADGRAARVYLLF